MGNYTWTNNRVGYSKEKVTGCGWTGGTQAKPVAIPDGTAKPLDAFDGEFEVPDLQRKREEYRAMGAGRNVTKLIELGYDPTEKDIAMKMQTLIWLYYVMGSVAHQGSDAASPYYYYHCIYESDTIPTMMIHSQQKLTSNDILVDMCGVFVKKVVIVIEKSGDVKLTASIMSMRNVATTYTHEANGNAYLATPYYNETIFTWDMTCRTDGDGGLAKAFAFDYNGSAIAGTAAAFLNECDRIEITIENDIEISHILGDEFPFKYKIGKRDYSIKARWTPTVKTLYDLKNVKLASYAGKIFFRFTLYDSISHWVTLLFDSLYLSDYPMTQTKEEGKQNTVEFELKNAPAFGSNAAGTCNIVGCDARSPAYYDEP